MGGGGVGGSHATGNQTPACSSMSDATAQYLEIADVE